MLISSPGVNNPFTFVDDGYSSQIGLFQFCHVLYGSFDCIYYDGFECIGPPDSWAFCNLRRASAGLMISALILSIIGCAYFGILGLKSSTARTAGFVAGSITLLAVILYIIAMSLMIYLKRIVEFNTLRTGMMPPGMMGPMGPMPLFSWYGASLVLAIIAWILGLIVALLMIMHGSAVKKDDDEPVIKEKEYSADYSSLKE
jgi:hypothetical protein